MNRKKYAMLALIVVLGFLATSDVFAAIYKYTDKDGMLTFADDLQSIPEQYRRTAIIVSGQAEEQKKPSTQTRTPAQSDATQAAPASRAQEPGQGTAGESARSVFSGRLLISLVVVVSALFSLVILNLFDEDHKKSMKVARVVILWGVSVYLVYTHAMDMVALFNRATGKIEAVQEESAEKGRTTAQKIKEYSAAMDQLGSPEKGPDADPQRKDSR